MLEYNIPTSAKLNFYNSLNIVILSLYINVLLVIPNVLLADFAASMHCDVDFSD